MIETGVRPKTKKKWKKKIVLIVGIIILVYSSISLFKNTKRSQEINNEIQTLEREITDLEKNNLELNELVKYFNSNAYIEEKARIDLGLKKEGEKVVVVSDNLKKRIDEVIKQESSSLEDKKKLSNPRKWWRHFFN